MHAITRHKYNPGGSQHKLLMAEVNADLGAPLCVGDSKTGPPPRITYIGVVHEQACSQKCQFTSCVPQYQRDIPVKVGPRASLSVGHE